MCPFENILYVSFETDTSVLYALAKEFEKEENIKNQTLLQTDIWTLVDNRPLIEELSNGFLEYITFDEEYKDLHENSKQQPDYAFLNDVERKYLFDYGETIESIINIHPRFGNKFNYRDYYHIAEPELIHLYFEKAIRKIIKTIEDFQPDAILTINFGYSFKKLIYYIAKRMDIPFLTVMSGRLKNHKVVFDNYSFGTPNYLKNFIKEFEGEPGEEAKLILQEVKENKANSYNRERQEQLKSDIYPSLFKCSFNYLKKVKQLCKVYFRRGSFGAKFMEASKFSSSFWKSLSVYFKKMIIYPRVQQRADLFVADPDLQQNFFYWPLHNVPESSIMTLGDFPDEKSLIKMVSNKIPAGYKLLLKENRNMFNNADARPKEFYSEIGAINNVIFVSPEFSSIELIAQSRGVISIAGTALLEAAFFGKKGFCLGKVPFDILPTIEKWDFCSVLTDTVRLEPEISDKILGAYLEAIIQNGEDIEHELAELRTGILGTLTDPEQHRSIMSIKRLFDRYFHSREESRKEQGEL